MTRSISLAGRRVLVTGAASGIGAAVAEAFKEAGAEVVATDVRAASGVLACDVRDSDAVEAAMAQGRITDLVHAAGIGAAGPLAEITLDDWTRVMEINLTGSFLVLRAAARRLGHGSTITLVASVGGLRGGALTAAYSASKFGVIGLMQAAARELAPRGIRVNAVCPGVVDTPMGDSFLWTRAALTGRPAEEVRQARDAQVPLGGAGTPAQIADACLYLASDLASYVAGTALVVHGGGPWP